jgi:hypothetical protein
MDMLARRDIRQRMANRQPILNDVFPMQYIKIHSQDNVAVALADMTAGSVVTIDNDPVTLALLKQMFFTISPSSAISAGASPAVTQRPIIWHRMRRK